MPPRITTFRNVDLELPALERGQPVPEDLLDPQTLTAALRLRRAQAESEGDEVRVLAACRLMAALRVGPIQDVADTLIEQFTGIIEDEDLDEDWDEEEEEDDDD